jgi:oxalate decarboxylase
MSNPNKEIEMVESPSRRSFLEGGSAVLAAAAFVGLTANAQQPEDARKAEGDHSSSDPGQENKSLPDENPNSNMPPPTDHGDIGPIWYSFDLARKRVEEGGWTNQVTQRELPPSTDITGVNMRLTRGSFRELHWHTSDEWAMMLDGNARITVLNPDGTTFIDDVTRVTSGSSPQAIHIPFKVWGQGMVASSCLFLTKACSRKTTPSSSPRGSHTHRLRY